MNEVHCRRSLQTRLEFENVLMKWLIFEMRHVCTAIIFDHVLRRHQCRKVIRTEAEMKKVFKFFTENWTRTEPFRCCYFHKFYASKSDWNIDDTSRRTYSSFLKFHSTRAKVDFTTSIVSIYDVRFNDNNNNNNGRKTRNTFYWFNFTFHQQRHLCPTEVLRKKSYCSLDEISYSYVSIWKRSENSSYFNRKAQSFSDRSKNTLGTFSMQHFWCCTTVCTQNTPTLK